MAVSEDDRVQEISTVAVSFLPFNVSLYRPSPYCELQGSFEKPASVSWSATRKRVILLDKVKDMIRVGLGGPTA